MDQNIITALAGAGALIIGIVLGKFIFSKNTEQKIKEAEEKAELIIKEAKGKSDNLFSKKKLEAKEHFLKLKSEHDKKANQRDNKLRDSEGRVKKKEGDLNKRLEQAKREFKEYSSKKEHLDQQLQIVDKKKHDLAKQQDEHVRALENVANLKAEDAKQELLEVMTSEAKNDAMAHIAEVMEEAKNTANKEAKKIVIQTIQRTAAEKAIENSISVFNLESDDVKGQIIGREGRNIRAIEAATGVDLVIDDTPEAILLSSFDPLRREIARLSLQRLTQDGRIHPARIEEVVAKTKRQIDEQVKEIGQRTVIDLGIHGLHKELIRMVGRMKFRSSYGQNLLMHSRETANLCGIMAAELGLNPKLAKRAGLLHDIGKVPDEDTELSHALLGAKLAEKYGEHAAVVNAIGAHHDEMEMKFVISPIIQACDAISGARPGARREIMQSYLQRIKDLEALALEFDGVEKAYAVQAGRELRVIVEAEKISDAESETLSFAIADKIQKEMQYPGQIKVTTIREKRAVNVAK